MTTLPTREQPPRLAGPVRPRGRPAAGPVAGITPRDILRVIRKRKWLIQTVLVTCLAVTAAATGLWATYWPHYRATALLEVRPPRETIIRAAGLPHLGTAIIDRYKRNFANLVRREDILEDAAKDDDLSKTTWYAKHKDEIIVALQESVGVAPLPETEYIEVSMGGTNKGELADIVNAVVVSAEKLLHEPLHRERQKQIEKLGDKERRLKLVLDRLRSDIATRRTTSDLAAMTERRTTVSQTLLLLTTKIQEAHEYAVGAEASLAEFGKSVNDGSFAQGFRVKQVLDMDPTLRGMTVRQQDLKNGLAEATRKFKPKHRAVQQLRAMLDNLDKEIAERKAQLVEEAIASFAQLHQNAAGVSKQREAELIQQRGIVKAEAADLEEIIGEIRALEQQADDLEKQLRVIRDRKLDLETLEPGPGGEREAGWVRIAAYATEPRIPKWPRWSTMLPLGGLLGLVLGFGLAFLFEYADTSIKAPSDIARRVDLPLLGMVPHEDDLDEEIDDFRRVALEAPQSIAAEAFRQIRTNLIYSAPAKERRCLLVTSPAPEDGRTTVVINLAVSMAQAGRRVLVIDANFRQPAIGDMFPEAEQTGLSSVLVGQADWKDVVSQTSLPNCEVMTAGPMPPNPGELLGSPAMERLLRELSDQYDQIIIDGSPLLIVTDSIILATQVDGVILVIRAGANSIGAVLKAVDQLRRIGAHLLGAVLQGVRATAGGYLRKNYDSFYEYHQKALP